MIEQSGTVVSNDNGVVRVMVAVDRQCARCEQGLGCGQGLVGRMGAAQSQYTIVGTTGFDTPVVGQRVVLGIAPHALLLASVLVYLVPLLLMTVMAMTAHHVGPGSDTVTGLAGLVGLLGGFACVRVTAARTGLHRRVEPRLLRTVSPPAERSVT